jgi:hypothetical protein
MHLFSFQTLQKIFLGVGLAGLAVSCVMTGKFGATMSSAHALGLVLVTIMAAFIMPAIRFVREAGIGRFGGNMLMMIGVFFLGVEFFSDLGYTIGTREKSTSEASVQQTAYKVQQDRLSDSRKNVSLWTKQLEDLKAANGWVATVSADGLRAQLAVMDKDIELETSRGGCKSKCRALMAKKADVENKIATAEEASSYAEKIAAAQRLADSATDKAVETKDGFSAVTSQTAFVAQLFGIASGDDAQAALNPDQTRMTLTQILVGFFIALSITALPAMAFYFAFFGKRPEFAEADVWAKQDARNQAAKAANARQSHADAAALAAYRTRHAADAGSLSSNIHISDERGIAELKKVLASHADRALSILQPNVGDFA